MKVGTRRRDACPVRREHREREPGDAPDAVADAVTADSEFRVQGSGFRVQESKFRAQGSGFRVQGSGFRVQGSGREGACLSTFHKWSWVAPALARIDSFNGEKWSLV